MRLLLIFTLLILALVGGIAVGLNHYFGLKGLIAFPFILIALIWCGKFLIGRLIKRFALGLFTMKSKVLRGATMIVHSITPVPEAANSDVQDADETEDEDDADDAEKSDESDQPEPKEMKYYYVVDMTITPRDCNGDRVWEPGELILASEQISSLVELEENDKEVGSTHEVLVWDGSAFGPDDPGKYAGSQRLRVTFAVKPATSRAWVHYYDEGIGTLELPRWIL